MATNQPKTYFVYVGTYTEKPESAREHAEGIFVYRLDPVQGSLDFVQAVSGVMNPSYLALTMDHRFLYAVNELAEFEGQPGGGVSAFSVDPNTGRLEFLNSQPSLGEHPCYVSVDESHGFVWVANYSGGNAAILPILVDGALAEPVAKIQHKGHGINPQRQEKAHVHSVVLDPGRNFALVADLGLDKICVYRTEDFYRGPGARPVCEVSARPGAGPRHLVFHPDGRYVYGVNELDATVSLLVYDPDGGELDEVQILSALPEEFKGTNTCADVHLTPDGKYLYVSNRGFDGITGFSVNKQDGRLTPVGYTATLGRTPRNFTITPDGQYLLAANQNSDSVVVFQIDPTTGELKPTGMVVTIPTPVCVKVAAI